MLGAGQEPRSDEDRRRFAGRLARYAALERAPSEAPGELHPGEGFPACEPPDIRTPPSFVVPYRRSILIDAIPVFVGDPVEGIPLIDMACVAVRRDGVELTASFPVTLTQRWNLVRTALGDLASIMALAPGEDVTLEVTQSQRKVLDEPTVDSVESRRSEESTTMDEVVVDVARSSARTQYWHVDGSGSYGIGLFKIGASGGASTTASESTQVSLQQVSETTRRSANSLKTLKRIAVHGVGESFVQDRSCCGTESLGTRCAPLVCAGGSSRPAQSPRDVAQPAVIRRGEEGRDANSA
jgi:hypothetical protein